MFSFEQPAYLPIVHPTDGPALARGEPHAGLVVSAVHGVNPRLRDLCALARERAGTLLVDPKTAHFQFEGYMSMPDYRALPYGAGGHKALGGVWRPAAFAAAEARRGLVDEVAAFQQGMGADLVLAPYFYVQRADDPWLEIAAATAAEAVAGAGDEVGVAVCVDIDAILDDEARARIAHAFTGVAAAAYLLQVVNYDERLADPRDMRAVRGLVEALAGTGRPTVLAFAGRTGLLAVACGAAGAASGAQRFEAHPRSFFREMMGSSPANRYYLQDCLIHLPVRQARAALDSDADLEHLPCSCPACRGTAVDRLVSRRLAAHALEQKRREVERLAAVPPPERLAALRAWLDAALERCQELAAALGDDGAGFSAGAFHYLEVIREVAGGPPASIPADDTF